MTDQNTYPQRMKVKTGKNLTCRKVEYVLRYHVLNKHKDPEAYTHHLLFIFYPLHDEENLKLENSPHTVQNFKNQGYLM